MNAIRLGIVGYGKIANDQHVPAITADPLFVLSAIADPLANGPVETFPDITTMLAKSDIDAVVMSQPPAFRYNAALAAIRAGKHVFLEKPPGATVTEVSLLIDAARANGVSLYTAWHSRMSPGSRELKRVLAGQRIDAIDIVWRENVRIWHPGQSWLWEQRGFGVFDPGVNALAILTDILDEVPRVTDAALDIPINRDAPIAARLIMETATGTPIHADFDFRETGTERWEMSVASSAGRYLLRRGGGALDLDGAKISLSAEAEYAGLYREFADLIRTGRSAADSAPLALVADAWMIGKRRPAAAFDL